MYFTLETIVPCTAICDECFDIPYELQINRVRTVLLKGFNPVIHLTSLSKLNFFYFNQIKSMTTNDSSD